MYKTQAMIIKSLSRKTNSHHQLVHYIFTDKEGQVDERQFTIMRGIYTDLDKEDMQASLEAVGDEFVENMGYSKERKNGVTMYHEVLSFDPLVSDKINKDMLKDITEQYIEKRAENALVLARPHFDAEHIHVHLMISANQQRSAKRSRISLKEFEECKAHTRAYQKEKYPEISPTKELQLGQKQYKEYWRRADKKAQMKQAGKSISEKSTIAEILEVGVKLSANFEQLAYFLAGRDIKTYSRRNVLTGVSIGKRNYRFGTLLKGKTTLTDRLKRFKEDSKIEKALKNQVKTLEKEKGMER